MAAMNSVIEFGTSKIICMMDSKSAKDLDMPGSSCIRYEGMRRGAWVNPDALLSAMELAIETAEKRSSRQIHSTHVGLPASAAFVTTKKVSMNTKDGAVTAELLKRMAESERIPDKKLVLTDVRPVYFMDASGELYIDLPIGLRTPRLTAVFSYVYARHKFVEDVCSLLDSMHVFVDRFLYEPYALAVKSIPERDRMNTVILVDVGYTETSVSVVYYDSVLATSLIGVGGQTFVNDLIQQMRVSGTVAEHLKRNHSFGLSVKTGGTVFAKNEEGRMESFDQSVVSSILDSRMYSFAESVRSAIGAFAKKKIISRNAVVFLGGAGLCMRGADVFLQNCINRRVQLCQFKKRSSLAPVFNTAIALLDCSRDPAYEICGGVYQGQTKHKIGKILR